ncbi:hypothetical protein [Rhizobium sp. BK176]|uniref:hypothetical protein n=1 Tax=Rhizobium sp. BK176 TaxID=2587071 RepID=UPI00216AA78A|nr:hypothetical protein [Rhizobium sp. BK176]MCS4089077.1 hypothetical protein [Rhizobium sp. BK176]
MSKAFAVNVVATLGAGVASTAFSVIAATAGKMEISVAVVGGLCSLVAIGSIGAMILPELKRAREWDAMKAEGRCLAERSDAAFRLRRQDTGHMEELERALTA